MKLTAIRIVLVATSHPGNIGSVARAMKTMGLQRLYLVKPKIFPDARANELAAGAKDVLENCQITQSLPEALVGCHLVFATTARIRELNLEELTPALCADLINKQPHSTEVAIVFGREQAGLTNEELLYCHFQVNIPSNPAYSSLNLAQAVQIIAYELQIKNTALVIKKNAQNNDLATANDVEKFYTHLFEVITAIGFFKENPRPLQQRLRRLFNRIRFERLEMNILRGILTHIQRKILK